MAQTNASHSHTSLPGSLLAALQERLWSCTIPLLEIASLDTSQMSRQVKGRSLHGAD